MTRYVQISPFYNGNGWYDPVSGIFFKDKNKEYKIDKTIDASKVEVFIRRNLLIDVTYRHNNITEKMIEDKKILEQAHNHPLASNHILKEEKYATPVEEKLETEVVVEDTVEEPKIEEIHEEVAVEITEEAPVVVEKTKEEVSVPKSTSKNSSKKKKGSKK